MTLIDDIIAREGRQYTDRPSDRGGPTKFGITLAVLSACRGTACTAADVAALEEDEARAIYHQRYIVGPRFAEIADARLQDLVVDFGVTSGQATAAKALQRAVGVTADGVVGGITLAALAKSDAATTYKRVLAARVRFIGHLITTDPAEAPNAAGWANRIAAFIEA